MKFPVISGLALLAVLSGADAFAAQSAGLLQLGALTNLHFASRAPALSSLRPTFRAGRRFALQVRRAGCDIVQNMVERSMEMSVRRALRKD